MKRIFDIALIFLALALAGCATCVVQNDASKWTIKLTSLDSLEDFPKDSYICHIYDQQNRLMMDGILMAGKMDGSWHSCGSQGEQLAIWSYRGGVRNGPVLMWYGPLEYP